ncbi:MAG: hypothetical protein PHW02_04475 [bacterium]|nr:hypothetical protein [bacterium]
MSKKIFFLLFLIICNFFLSADSLSFSPSPSANISSEESAKNSLTFVLSENKDSIQVYFTMYNGFTKDSSLFFNDTALCFDLSHFIFKEMPNESLNIDLCLIGFKEYYLCSDSLAYKILDDSAFSTLHQKLSVAGIVISREMFFVHSEPDYGKYSFSLNFENSYINNVKFYSEYDYSPSFSDVIFGENINNLSYSLMIDSISNRDDSALLMSMFGGKLLREEDLCSYYKKEGEFYSLMMDYDKYCQLKNYKNKFTSCIIVPLGVFFAGFTVGFVIYTYNSEDPVVGFFLLPVLLVYEGVTLLASFSVQHFFNKSIDFIFKSKRQRGEEDIRKIREQIIEASSISEEKERLPIYRMIRTLMNTEIMEKN